MCCKAEDEVCVAQMSGPPHDQVYKLYLSKCDATWTAQLNISVHIFHAFKLFYFIFNLRMKCEYFYIRKNIEDEFHRLTTI